MWCRPKLSGGTFVWSGGHEQAHRFSGLVASTVNFSELGAGFWTLHGDVGDLAPVQSLIKSWEVPWMARAFGVPERTWRANPTDGLGIGGGDEAQIGVSYLEWDVMVFALLEGLSRNPGLTAEELTEALEIGGDIHARTALDTVLRRLRSTWYKRSNPIRLDHPVAERYEALDALDARLFRPAVLRADEALSRFSGELQDVANQLADALKASERRLVTAESCTAGLLAACVSGTPGSSGVLEGSFVTYCSSLKSDALGVSAELMEEKMPYHPEVARQMASAPWIGHRAPLLRWRSRASAGQVRTRVSRRGSCIPAQPCEGRLHTWRSTTSPAVRRRCLLLQSELHCISG